MRKLYALIAAVALVPLAEAEGCGGDDTGAGGSTGTSISQGAAGGTIQDFDYTLVLQWTVLGMPAAMGCGTAMGDTVDVTLSGTEDIGEHKETKVDCTKGTVTFPGLTRLKSGAMPLLDARLLRTMGTELILVYEENVPVNAAPGTQTYNIDFEPPASLTSTSQQQASQASTGGNGGGGNGGASNGGGGAANGGGGAPANGGGGAGGVGGTTTSVTTTHAAATHAAATHAAATHAATTAAATGAGGAGGT